MTANATPDPWTRTRKGKPSLGEVATREYTLTDEHAQAWAEISQDFNPLHFDEDAAEKSIFGRRVGHGGLMQAVLHGIVGMDLPGPGTASCTWTGDCRIPSTSTRRSWDGSRSWRSATTSRCACWRRRSRDPTA